MVSDESPGNSELQPSKRIAASFLVGAIGAGFQFADHLRLPEGHSDFGAVWFGARALLNHESPYALVGPGLQFDWDFPLNYPGTALVAAIPLTPLPEVWASVVFVFLSCFALAYGLFRENWNRVWILPSAAFIVACRAGQWSPLIAAAFLIPSLGFILAGKPSIGIPVAASVSTKQTLTSFLVGGFLLFAVSFALYPAWPVEWLAIVSEASEFSSPITRTGGPLILIALLRWRRPEARLLLMLALFPQTPSWYEALLPMLVAQSRRESQALSMTSSIGYLLLVPLALASGAGEIASSEIGSMMIAFCYLPAVIVVLRKPNVGQIPAWLEVLLRAGRPRLVQRGEGSA